MKALDLSCPKKRCKSKYKFPTWWNPNLSKMRAKMHFMAKKKSTLRAEMLTGLSAESINLQLPMQKMMDVFLPAKGERQFPIDLRTFDTR